MKQFDYGIATDSLDHLDMQRLTDLGVRAMELVEPPHELLRVRALALGVLTVIHRNGSFEGYNAQRLWNSNEDHIIGHLYKPSAINQAAEFIRIEWNPNSNAVLLHDKVQRPIGVTYMRARPAFRLTQRITAFTDAQHVEAAAKSMVEPQAGGGFTQHNKHRTPPRPVRGWLERLLALRAAIKTGQT